MLPSLGYMSLYNEFHHDEPWDSDHNKALIEQMPEEFLVPGVESEPGHTHYQMVTGEDTLFNGGPGPRIGAFRDGTSMTAILVQADTPVIWTSPDDWEYNPEDPLQDLGHIQEGDVFMAGFADGHIEFISTLADPEMIGAIFTGDGGEYVDTYELRGN